MDDSNNAAVPVIPGYTSDGTEQCQEGETYLLSNWSSHDNRLCLNSAEEEDCNTFSRWTTSLETNKPVTIKEMHDAPQNAGTEGHVNISVSECLLNSNLLSKRNSSLILPVLEQLLENELEDESCILNDVLSGVPDFEVLLPDIQEPMTKICSDHMQNVDTRTVINELKDLRNELIIKEDNGDFGLGLLFEEEKKRKSTPARSKVATKRKKYLKKLQKLSTSHVTESTKNRKQKCVQSFQELQNSRPVFEDHDIDSSLTCPVCLEMYHLPRRCNPCGHMFCDPCLRRLTGQGSEGVPCPLCRTVISSCDLDKEFNDHLVLTHPYIYTARAQTEHHSKFRHYKLPYTAPVPLGRRLLRQLVAGRNSQSDSRWMSHDWFKFLLGCTAGMFLSLLIILLNRVKSVRDAREVNIVFLSILFGASVTFLIFKYIKI